MYINTRNDYKQALASQVPTAHITTNKSRLKLHNSNPKNVYLKDGDNFEFELFNPTKNVVLAKISLDGKLISNTGLILNPGQRVFLDRFINEAKKFKFSTYEVSGTNAEVKQAISDNGAVTVSFYNEYIPIDWSIGTITTNYYNGILNTPTTGNPIIYPSFTTSTFNVSNSSGTVTMDSLGFGAEYSMSRSNSNEPLKKSVLRSMSKPIETGRVEKGEKSKQTFTTVNKDFCTTAFHIVEYKILPVSQVEVKDLKRYCGGCGKTVKATWKFCTSCGTQLD